jgi:PhzF family phenazine biosynthesis protein
MTKFPFASYDAFTDTSFGGSQAFVISDAAGFDSDTMRKIAVETGAPATCFVLETGANMIRARFMSTVAELPMCGHGTMCLMTRMVEEGIIPLNNGAKVDVELHLPANVATVELTRRDDDRPQILLDIQAPTFRQDSVDPGELAALLGITTDDFSEDYPIETAVGDFIHLVVPVKNLPVMQRITPDFNGIVTFCHKHDVQTVAVFCREVEQADHSIHVRDFCPAVGVPESAAAGTTNGALTSYLIRHKIVQQNDKGVITVQAEQGHEIRRRSSVRSIATMNGDAIARLQVGGVATKIMDGELHLPTAPL